LEKKELDVKFQEVMLSFPEVAQAMLLLLKFFGL